MKPVMWLDAVRAPVKSACVSTILSAVSLHGIFLVQVGRVLNATPFAIVDLSSTSVAMPSVKIQKIVSPARKTAGSAVVGEEHAASVKLISMPLSPSPGVPKISHAKAVCAGWMYSVARHLGMTTAPTLPMHRAVPNAHVENQRETSSAVTVFVRNPWRPAVGVLRIAEDANTAEMTPVMPTRPATRVLKTVALV